MPLSVTTDPLADYTPDWRQHQGADPLAGYSPNWRSASTTSFQLPQIKRAGRDVTAVQLDPRSSGPLGPTIEGAIEGTGRVIAGAVKFPFHVLATTVFAPPTPEELRNPYVRARLRANGADPDAMLHEAIVETAQGQRASPGQGVQDLATGTLMFGHQLESQILPGPNLGNLIYDKLTGKQSSQELIEQNPQAIALAFEPRQRAAAFTELLGNAALLGLGGREARIARERAAAVRAPAPEPPPAPAAVEAAPPLPEAAPVAEPAPPVPEAPPVEAAPEPTLKVPEFVRATPEDVQAYHETTAPASTTIVRMPVADIVADPARFQFKQLGSEGVTAELKGVTRFNDQLAGVVSVWRDPVDGKFYVVNGHHRLDLARRLGRDALNVQFIDAPNAVEARAAGAFINIAEGRGTATDVGKFLRDMNATPEDMAARGVTLTSQLSRDGVALSRLAPDIFDQVATAKIPQSWGVAMGDLLPDPILQREALAVMKGGQRLTQGEAYEVARQVRDAGTETVTQENLFGADVTRRGLFLNRARVAAALRRRLATDKKLFGFVSQEGRAQELARAGTTQIDVAAASDIAAGADRALEVFDKLYSKTGPLADVVAQGAKRVAHGESPSTVAASIYGDVGNAVAAELRALSGAGPDIGQRPDAGPVRSLADEIAATPEEPRVADSHDVAQAGMFDTVAGVIETGKGQADIFARPLEDPRRGSIHATPDPLEAHVNPASLTPSARAVQEQISVGERGAFDLGLRSLYAKLVRRTDPLEQAARKLAGGQERPSGHDPGASAILASGSGARAEAFLESGPFLLDEVGNPVPTGTPSLKAILAPLKGKLNEFRRYAVSWRVAEAAAKGETVVGVPVADAFHVLESADPAIKIAHAQAAQYNADVLRYWRASGGVSPAAIQAMARIQETGMPLRDVFAGRDVAPPNVRPTQRPGTTITPLSEVRTKAGKIKDPIEVMVDQTRRLIRAADTQRIAAQLVELADAFPENAKGLVERIGAPRAAKQGEAFTPEPLSVAAKRLKESAAARGIVLTDEAAIELSGQLTSPVEGPGSKTLLVHRNGMLEKWRTSPEVGAALDALSPQQAVWWARFLGAPAQALKVGITANPVWAGFNFIRDTFDATLQSRYGFRLGLDSFRGFYEALRKGPRYQEFLRSGGGYADIVGEGGRSFTDLFRKEARYPTQRAVSRIVPRSVGAKVSEVVRHPIQALKDFGRPFETSARLGEFMRARERGATVEQAALAARQVTTDFSMMGTKMQAWSQMTAFMNPGIQSLDTAFRVLRDHPGRLFALGTAAISLPTLALWLANRKDQAINDLRRTPGGATFWFTRDPWGRIVKVPKPFLWGQVFGTGMETALDRAFEQQPEAMGRWADAVTAQIGANVIPNGLLIWDGLRYNREPFFRTPIVPEGMENVDPQYQAQEYNTTLSRRLGAAFGVSPARFEFVVRQLAGTVGLDVVKGASNVVDEVTGTPHAVPPPASVEADWPVVGKLFARYPSTAVEPVRTFYDHAAGAERMVNTVKLLARRDPEKAQAYLNAHMPEIGMAGAYVAGRAELAALRRQLDVVRQDPGTDAETKRQMMDEILREMVETARRYNTAVRDLLEHRETP